MKKPKVYSCRRCGVKMSRLWHEIQDTKSLNKMKLCGNCGDGFYAWMQKKEKK